MSAWLPSPGRVDRDGAPGTSIVQPGPTREERRARMGIQAARWHAVELAEHVFGGAVRSRLSGAGRPGPVRGILELEVPWSGLDAHHDAEARFLAAAADDTLLASIPLLFVFGVSGTAPDRAPGGRARPARVP